MNQSNMDKLLNYYSYGSIAAGAALIVAKLAGAVSWSWWLITAPLYVNMVVALVALVWAHWYLNKEK